MTRPAAVGLGAGAVVALTLALGVLAGTFLGSDPAPAMPETAPVSDVHHDLKVTLDPNSRAFSARDRITLKGKGVVAFRLSPHLNVTEVLVDGRRARPLGRPGGNWLSNDPPGPPTEWLISLQSEQVAEHEVLIDIAGTLAELPDDRRRADFSRPMAGSEGSFLSGHSAWYPQFGADFFTFDLTVRVADPHRAVAPGRLSDETQGEGYWQARYSVDHPVDEIVLMSGPWVIEERMRGDVRLRTWFYARDRGMAADYLDLVDGYLDLYEDWIGAYPFPAFHVVAGPLPVGLGYTNLTYIGAPVLRLPFIRHTSLGHEVLHTWWGNGVYVDYASGNWAEGLTTFMADYTYARRKNADEARRMRLEWLRDYAALPAARDAPVVSFTSKSHTASQVVGYNKVAFLFHMLRRRIGEDAFNNAIRRFWRENRFQVADWNDVAGAFERAAERSLDPFFDQWLHRTGAPVLRLTAAETIPADGGFAVRVTVTQDQDGAAYDLLVPVRVDTDAGPVAATLALDRRSGSLEVRTEARPLAVTVDPDFDVFRRLQPGESPPVLRDMLLGENTPTVLLTDDAAAMATARRLAGRMLDTAPKFIEADPAALAGVGTPALVIGIGSKVEDFLRRAGLGPVPAAVAGRGTARAWAADGVAVVMADDPAALESVLRPLPHYGRRSFVVFDGSEAVEKGVWPEPPDNPLKKVL